jgi:cell division protein FtsI (penicillin-binding protein 3)
MKRRLVIFAVLVVAWSGGIGARLWDLQVRRHPDFARKAASQQQRVVEVAAPRGAIYDARGRELAVSVEVESVYAAPGEVAIDRHATAGALAPILRQNAAELAQRLDSDREFVWVARKLDPATSSRVRELALPGIYFLTESRRYYPMRELAAHALGYVGMDGEGLGGLEARYEDVVRGQSVSRVLLRDALRGSVALPEHPFDEPVPGRDLHLTLDASLQYIAEKELRVAVETSRAQSGVVIVLDPSDSAILTMASYPTFDPNAFSRYAPGTWKNRAIADVFEPGSTFKMVTAAAAFESLKVSPEDPFFCENGRIVLGKTRINDHKSFGHLTFREVIAKSSNVGVIKAALIVGDERLHSMITAFGFGRRSGVDLPGESPGIVHPVERWSRIAKAYISFGQGISVTPLQLANSFAALANGGVVHRPYLVRAIGHDGVREEVERQPAFGRAITPQTAVTLERVLETVVTAGTGRRADVPGYRVAGKTGTAQKVIPGVGYSPNGRMASFVGFVPARRPRLVCLVLLDEPRGLTHGGDVAAPVFQAVMKQALLYLGVPPDPELLEEKPELMRPRLRPQAGARVMRASTGAVPVPADDRPAAGVERGAG